MKLFRHGEMDEDPLSEAVEEVDNPTTPIAAQADDLEAMHDLLKNLHDKFDTRMRDDAAKEQLFNRLYDDLQARRQEQMDNHLLPLVRSILLVLDRIADQMSLSHSPGELETVRAELLDALYAVGVEPIVVPRDAHDTRLQQVVEAVPSTNGAWEERRPGYLIGNRVLRPQQIAVRQDRVAEESV